MFVIRLIDTCLSRDVFISVCLYISPQMIYHMANRKRTRTQKRQRKRRGGGTTRKKLTKLTFGDLSVSPDTSIESHASSPKSPGMSSAEVDQLIRELPQKYGRPRSTERLPNIHCGKQIEKEKQLCRNSIKRAMEFASNQCDKEIEKNNEKWKKRNKSNKISRNNSNKISRNNRPPWRPAGPVRYPY